MDPQGQLSAGQEGDQGGVIFGAEMPSATMPGRDCASRRSGTVGPCQMVGRAAGAGAERVRPGMAIPTSRRSALPGAMGRPMPPRVGSSECHLLHCLTLRAYGSALCAA